MWRAYLGRVGRYRGWRRSRRRRRVSRRRSKTRRSRRNEVSTQCVGAVFNTGVDYLCPRNFIRFVYRVWRRRTSQTYPDPHHRIGR